jgi:hypothetical protein
MIDQWEDLEQLLQWMRDNGVAHARVGDLELRTDPAWAELGDTAVYADDDDEINLDRHPLLSPRQDYRSIYEDPDLWDGHPPYGVREAMKETPEMGKPSKAKGEASDPE